MRKKEYKQIGKKLRLMREFRGIKPTDLAKFLGLSRQQINNYENARSGASFPRIDSICSYLQFDIKYIDKSIRCEEISKYCKISVARLK
jgi:transcriptional regulator with XRE-family HTH domain